MIIKGVCCAYCLKFEKRACPVKTADPWRKWRDYCGQYEKNKTIPEASNLFEAVILSGWNSIEARMIYAALIGDKPGEGSNTGVGLINHKDIDIEQRR